ncbi:MAG: gliding motility-associated C-terminal domain-containing protein [Bacteroidales bacterium]|nr:gliding motility-associated C-terminal domain-containing protein [Bacteroidales bacterium]
MKIITKTLLMALMLLFVSSQCLATHNRAGEIVYKHLRGYTYKIIIYTYCYTQTEADRDELEVDCGDGTEKLKVKRLSKTLLDDNNSLNISYLCKNVYEGEHTFSGPGTYVLYMEDPNRNDGVLNIPNSVNVVFAIKTTLVINSVTGNNTSPILLNPPMDKAALHKTFVHNPGAYDPDGDSLSYRIATCLQQDGQEILGYTLPPVSDTIYVNPRTGDFVWEKPSRVGTYNVAMWIEEWRKGVKIGQVLRDIQVEVIDTDNHTPVIDKQAKHCVVAGDKLEFNITATDPDRDLIHMTATGGPFEVAESPARITINEDWTRLPLGQFSWQTIQSHVRNMPYDMLIKAVDNDGKVPLTAYETVNIRVVAPAPKIQTLKPMDRSYKLTWEYPGNNKAVGYRIYRKDRPDEWSPDYCQTGLPSESGYKLVDEVKNGVIMEYTDHDHGRGLPTGFKYCYRITAIFEDGAESLVSDNACGIMSRNIVMYTKASVESTDEATGKVIVEWTKPDTEKIDPEVTPPPYYYEFYKKGGIGENMGNGGDDEIWRNPERLDIDYPEFEPTRYDDINKDTKNKGRSYKMDLRSSSYDGGPDGEFGVGPQTSTVFIKLQASDRTITVTHECDVPWKNDTFVVYRKDPDKSTFDSIGYSTTGTYVDRKGLINDMEYGYKMKTIGYYSADNLPTHIENFSQEAYAKPIDTIPPCVKLSVKSQCDLVQNKLAWRPDTVCGLGIEKYMIFYSETLDGQLTKIDEVDGLTTQYSHQPVRGMAGCYAVAARDSAGNEGVPDSRVCVDMCDYYKLPNVFTPNGDERNDVFHAYPYQFVDHVEMTITNRWGKVVFETTNPDINWDGTDKNTGTLVPDGVYFYRCVVYEYRLTGLEPRDLEGYITVFARKTKKN